MKKIITLFIIFSIMLSFGSPVYAHESFLQSVQAHSNFDELDEKNISTSLKDVWDVDTNTVSLIPRLDKIGKHLLIRPAIYNGNDSLEVLKQKKSISFTGDFIIEGSFSIKNHSKCVLELADLKYNAGSMNLLSVNASGNLIDINERIICSVKEDKYYRFSLVISQRKKTYDIYLNGKSVGKGIDLPADYTGRSDSKRWIIKVSDIKNNCNSRLYLDDLVVYSTYSGKPCPEETFYEMYSDEKPKDLNGGLVFINEVPRMMYMGNVSGCIAPKIIDDIPYIPLRYSVNLLQDADIQFESENGGVARLQYGENKLTVTNGENGSLVDGNLLVNAYDFAKFISYTLWFDKESGIIFLRNKYKYPSWYANKDVINETLKTIIYDNPSAQNIENDFSEIVAGQHPRVIINQEKLNSILEATSTNSTIAKYAEDIINKATIYTNDGPTAYQIPDGLRLYEACDTARNRIMYMSMAYLLTQRPAMKAMFAEKVWEEVNNVCTVWTDWNPYHFLDTGLMTMAVAVAYDWLYDYWTPEQKAVMKNAIYNRGVQAILDDLLDRQRVRVNNWLDLENNWTMVCVGGVGSGALAIADIDEYSEDCSLMLEQGLMQLQRSLPNYGPDGGYIEGTSYWGLASEFFGRFISSLQNCCGTDYGLMRAPGLKQTGYFPLAMMGPGGIYNFSDSDGGVSRAVLFFSNYFNDAYLQQAYSNFETGQSRAGTVDSIVWYNPALENNGSVMDDVNYYRILETITMRDTRNMNTDNFIGFHTGDNDASHAHLDMGSFVLDMNGKRFALDLGKVDYNQAGGDFRYRYSAEGHNTWVINPDNTTTQNKTAFCKIDRYDYDDDEAFAISNLTDAYRGKIKYIKRGIMATDNYSKIIVQDELNNGTEHFEGYWQMHTEADINILDGGKQAVLTIGNDCVLVTLLTDNNAVFEVKDCESYPGTARPNTSTVDADKKKLVLHFDNITKETISVEFQHFTKNAELPTVHHSVTALNEWKLN